MLACLVAGVQYVGIEGEEESDQLVVVGDGVDSTSLTSCLRKTVKVGRADIIKVEEVVDEKAEAAGDAATGCSNPVAAWPPQGYPYCHLGYGCCCPRTGVSSTRTPPATASSTPTRVRHAQSCRCTEPRIELGTKSTAM